ncbi:HPP family protein [Halorarius litoreus]|uniref:HPP family protein n=1 Tax=Halorarius litoreus TaxID=2962676 RepID=UPI0020CCBA35|nr:HPP family protein [Halorarius litoreus]
MDGPRERVRTVLLRLRRLERREVREFRAWLETTRNLVHLTVLLLVPLLIALVTAISNAESFLPFVLFPPLASGTFTLFSEPEGQYASPLRFVGGLTAGAVCGSLAVAAALFTGAIDPSAVGTLRGISPVAAALAVFLTGGVTWAFDVEEPSAFSTALLALIAPAFTPGDPIVEVLGLFVASVFAAASLVASVFYVWRERFYERRAEFLYQSTKGDDHVLVPIRGDDPRSTVMLGARLAAAHDAGKVVLLDVVEDEDVAAARRDILHADEPAAETMAEDARPADPARPVAPETDEDTTETADTSDEALDEQAEERAAATVATELEAMAGRVETKVGVPCQVAVAVESATRAQTVLTAAHEANCDLIVTPYEERHGALSPFVRDLFRSDTDVLVHRPGGEQTRTRWRDVLVPVRRASDAAHTMVDFGTRLSGGVGRVAVCTCIGPRDDRRRAESMLSDLVETFHGSLETRVARQPIEKFLARNAPQFDLVIIGASTERSKASRFISPPTFERIQELECDVAVLDRNY